MYKLVVVDDETAIRQGMCNYINWNEMGFEVACDFEDGKETIEYIEKYPVDAVLTDIEMAEITGLELARYIYDHKLDIKVVIISGYKEFEYARKAVQYNVEHYLLKPVRMNEVQEVFDKIRIELDRKKSVQDKDKEEKHHFEELLPELQEQFWISLLVGGLRSRSRIEQKRKLLHLDFETDKTCAVINVECRIDEDSNVKYYSLGENKANLINNIFDDSEGSVRYYSAYLSSDLIKVIAVSKKDCHQEEFEVILKEKMTEKREAVSKLLKLDMVIEVEKVFCDIMTLAEYKYTLQMHVESESRGTRLVKEDYDRLMHKYRLLIETIGEGDFEELDNLMENIFFEFRKIPIEQVKHMVIDMFSMLSSKFMKMGSDLWISLNEKVDYQELMEIDNRGLLKEICKRRLKEVTDIVNTKQNEVSKSVVEKSIAYMKEHYGEDISLEGMADRYFLNPTYYSRLFKQYTGTTFTDYLIELRMEMAKKLIAEGKYKIYEVSQMVGYRSDKYFFRVFKQYTKRSPKEYYRNKVLIDEEGKK